MWVRDMSGDSSKLTVGRAVDWGFAATVGAKLARPGPATTDYTRRQVVEQLSSAALRAEMPVREVTGLNEGGEVADARIVDRAEWIRAASQSMRTMTGGQRERRQAALHHRPRHRRADGCGAGVHLVGHPRPVRPVRR